MENVVVTVTQRVAPSTSIVAEFRSVATFRGGHAERFLPPPKLNCPYLRTRALKLRLDSSLDSSNPTQPHTRIGTIAKNGDARRVV